MNNLVTFNNSQFNLVEYNGELWMTCPQIVDALGMADRRGVSNIYQRHKMEFDDTMTCLPTKGKYRIFNREGAWLIGMFARTPKAAEFRKWVLKVLGTVADNLTPTDKPVLVAEHTRALPSPKKEIVLSEKAKQEIGGIVKAVVKSSIGEYTTTLINEDFMIAIRNLFKEYIKDSVLEVFQNEFKKSQQYLEVENKVYKQLLINEEERCRNLQAQISKVKSVIA
ncbi:MAG: hypothetical protein IJ564_00015 [Alphaproteobacteria bacterium]|nr:hypothetical protein [Alphaproteobacteria bacterium]